MRNKVKTVQVGDKVLIIDGFSPLRYLDLTTNVVTQYPGIIFCYDGQFYFRKRAK